MFLFDDQVIKSLLNFVSANLDNKMEHIDGF